VWYNFGMLTATEPYAVLQVLRHASPEELRELLRLTVESPEEAYALLARLREKYAIPKEEPLWKRATPSELKQAIREWVDEERPSAPPLSEDALRRESLYA